MAAVPLLPFAAAVSDGLLLRKLINKGLSTARLLSQLSLSLALWPLRSSTGVGVHTCVSSSSFLIKSCGYSASTLGVYVIQSKASGWPAAVEPPLYSEKITESTDAAAASGSNQQRCET